eukprot:6719856-Ditylum_brightwellii.AAC.1
MAILFLTTRVEFPDKDICEKLRMIILYLNGTLDMSLTLSIDNLNVPKWWVDGAYAVHPNMHGHTGIPMSLGEGSVLSWPMKQKLNTKMQYV